MQLFHPLLYFSYLIYTLSKEKVEFRNDKPVTYESALFSGHGEQIAGSIGPQTCFSKQSINKKSCPRDTGSQQEQMFNDAGHKFDMSMS